MPQTHDYRHHFRGLHGSPSLCRVRVYRGSGGATLIIATELADNPGTSVTNAAEELATALERRHCPDPGERMLWVEHYPASVGDRGRALPERFALVTFERADDGRLHRPQWWHVAAAGLAEVLGQLVDA